MSALMTVFETQRDELVNWAKKLNSYDPEDSVQNAVVNALEKRYDEKYDESKKLPPLAYARLLVFWQVRSEQRDAVKRAGIVRGGYDTTEPDDALDYAKHEAYDEAIEEPASDCEREEIVYDVRKAVSELPDEERWAAEAVLLDGLTMEEYAQLRGMSKSWAFKVVEKARASLRDALRHYDTR